MLDLDHSISDCRAALTRPAPERAIKEILERTVASSSDVEAALGTPRQAQVVTLPHGHDLTILNVVWAPGMEVFPHDHRTWALIGLYGGREDNTFYRRGPDGLQLEGSRQLERGDTTFLGKDVIHAVANPLRVLTGAIHIYGGDFFGTPRSEWDPGTGEERPFDVERTRKVFADANERWLASEARRAEPSR